MKTGLGLFISLAVLVAACLPGRHSWRQQLTLVVDTLAGPVTGTSVVGVSVTYTPGSAIFNEVHYTLRGEATVVEVAPGRFLFALLGGSEERFARAAKDRFEGMTRGEWLRLIPRQTEPVALAGDTLPMLVTFDDIDDPATVRRVDPDDLDAAFGCARTDGLPFPWRAAGLPYADWAAAEVARLAREQAGARAGLPPEAGAALDAFFAIIDDRAYDAEDELVIDQLRLRFTEVEQRDWEKARWTLSQELPATLPTTESLAAPAGGPCFRLAGATLAITREPVTEGRVEAMLGWWPAMRSGPFDEMTPLRLPNNSPRGWDHLSATEFWSLDKVLQLSGENE